MSKNLELKPYMYKVRCDIYGCSNIAEQTLGNPGQPNNVKLNICNECLQTIVNIVPLDMILNRPEIQALQTTIEDAAEVEEVGKAQIGDLKDLKYEELREIAKSKGLKVPIGMTKLDLIAAIEGN